MKPATPIVILIHNTLQEGHSLLSDPEIVL